MFCSYIDDKVVDSRISKDAAVIRRRRQCLKCGRRFTTYERIEEIEFFVVKKSGSREPYNRFKVKNGIMKALQKRSVSVTQTNEFLDTLEANFQEQNIREISTKELGEAVMNWLCKIDDVAYVRFVSVYREFHNILEFMAELQKIIVSPKKTMENLK